MHILEIKIKRRLLMYVYKSNYSEYWQYTYIKINGIYEACPFLFN